MPRSSKTSTEILLRQRVNVNFRVKNGEEIIEMLKFVYKVETMNCASVFKSYKLFKDGRQSIENDTLRK